MGQLLSRQAFQQAMDLHGDAVLRLAMCRLQNRADAEDVYQEVFLRLLQSPPIEDGEKQKAWLLRVTINCCHDLRRSAWFRRRAPLTEAGEMGAEMPDSALWQAVAALPPDLRTAVHLHYAEGYSTGEIAKLTGCRPATVRTRLHRARKALKTTLEEDLDDEDEYERVPGLPEADHSV